MNAKLSKSVNQAKKFIKKYSPEILTGVSIVSGIAATVWACKKTLDVEKEIAPVKEELDAIRNEAAEAETKPEAKELIKVYGKGAKVVAKNYGGPIGLGLLSIISNGVSTGISRAQINTIEAAAIVLSTKFANYRQNVVEDQGEDKDYMYYHDLKEETVEKVVEDPETGKKKKTKEKVLLKKKPNGLSDLAIEFGPGNPNWNESPMVVRSFLECVEKYANNIYALNSTDEYFMDKIYDALGYEKQDLNKIQRRAARVMGWSKKQNPNKRISIGIFEPINDRANEAADSNDSRGEAVFWLDFNIDGYIDEDYESIK